MICDMAEVYRIYDIFDMQPLFIAILANGLSDDSRTKRKINGQKLRSDIFLLAGIQDALNYLIYGMADPKKRGNPPDSILNMLLNGKDEEKAQLYESPEDFRLAWKQIIGNSNG